MRIVFGPRGYSNDRNKVLLLDLKRWRDHLLSVGVVPDAKVVIDRTEGFGGCIYANDLYLDKRHEGSPLIFFGAYLKKGEAVVVDQR